LTDVYHFAAGTKVGRSASNFVHVTEMISGNVAAISSAKKDAILLASDSWRLYARCGTRGRMISIKCGFSILEDARRRV